MITNSGRIGMFLISERRVVKDYDFRWKELWLSMDILKSCIGPAQMQAKDKVPVAMGFV